MKRYLKLIKTSAERGQSIVLIALTMGALLAFAVLAIDGGRFYTQRRTAQNASDMAALAGIYVFRNAPNTVIGGVVTRNAPNDVVLKKIQQLAQANEISDSYGVPDDGINENVQAWWLDISGNQLAPIQNDGSQYPPPGTNGVEVRTWIHYDTFIGGLVGQPNLTAQADGSAHITWSSKPIPGITDQAVWVGGGADCNNLTDRIAHDYSNTNSAEFFGSVYINGSLAVGHVNSTKFHGDVKVSGPVGAGPIDGGAAYGSNPTQYLPYTGTNPFAPPTNHGNQFLNSSQFYAGVPPQPQGVSPWAMLTSTVNPDGTFTTAGVTPWQLDASDFLPPAGEMYKRYLYVYQPLGLAPANFYNPPIEGDNLHYTGYAAQQIDTLATSGVGGIFIVQGDMTVTNTISTTSWNGITLIVTGKFLSNDNNLTFTTAGPAARNISVLAGADLSASSGNTADRCASDRSKWVFQVNGNKNVFKGTIYVPHGQALFQGNTSGGQTHSGALVVYSLYLGSADNNCSPNGNGSCEAQNWPFEVNTSLMGDPFPSTTLQQ